MAHPRTRWCSVVLGLAVVSVLASCAPTAVFPPEPDEIAMAISAGSTHSCAVIAGGTVRCWGSNESGQLGDGTHSSSARPVLVSGVSDAVAVSAGGDFTCATLAGGTVKCWGSNEYGQLGTGTTFADSPVPMVVVGLSDVVGIASGEWKKACAVVSGGTVKCWGLGMLGDGTGFNSSTPVDAVGLTDAVAVSVGRFHSCALREVGTVKCWGQNYGSELGDGTNIVIQVLPVDVVGVADATQLGEGASCVGVSTGQAKCWGPNNSGQLGDGTNTTSNVPVEVTSLTDVTAITKENQRACALLAGGAVKCWGGGYLGDGGNHSSNTPVDVIGLTDATAISNGGVHSCALESSGKVKCWGYNSYGQLGDNTVDTSFSPVGVYGLR